MNQLKDLMDARAFIAFYFACKRLGIAMDDSSGYKFSVTETSCSHYMYDILVMKQIPFSNGLNVFFDSQDIKIEI